MIEHSRTTNFWLMLNFTGMVRIAFALPCPVLSLLVLDHQVSMLKRGQKYFFSNFFVVAALLPKIKGRL